MPSISVIMPARNEGHGLIDTIRSVFYTRRLDHDLEIVVADDGSSDGSIEILKGEFRGSNVRVVSCAKRMGVARSRNLAARAAEGDILFITDSHVQFCEGWDGLVVDHLRPSTILAATIADLETSFRGYGCRLVVPFMGTYWNTGGHEEMQPVQIASSAGTVIHRDSFHALDGFDEGMRIYGAAEPEFSVRAWLAGLEIYSLPALTVRHQFKSRARRTRLMSSRRKFLVHNNLRFGLLYLGEETALQMIRLLAWEFPAQFHEALRMVEASDVFQRREYLSANLKHTFSWFVEKFDLKDQAGEPIPSS